MAWHTRTKIRPVAILLLVAAAACRPSREAGPGSATAQDSATWTLATQPLVYIGSAGQGGHELDRVYGGVANPDGSVVVGNSGTRELRFFDRGGALRRAAGRGGRGPGEFQAINWLRPYRGDSLIAFDLRSQRFSVWSAAGEFGRVFQPGSPAPSSRAVGVFSDASILIATDRPYDPRQGEGVVRDEFELSRISPTGELIANLGRLSGTEWLLYRHPAAFGATQPPFGTVAHVALAGDNVAYASSDSGRVALHDAAGRLVRTIQVLVQPRKVTPAMVEQALRETVDEVERRAVRRHLEGLRNATEPAISDLRADRRGRLWIRTPAGGPEMSRWLVYDTAGRQEGSILMPSSHLPLDIHSDRLLVRETDVNGVQHVALREVVR